MKSTVFVYGPAGSGKTKRAKRLQKHFGLKFVLDEWEVGDKIPAFDTLVLTQARLDELPSRFMKYDIKRLKC